MQADYMTSHRLCVAPMMDRTDRHLRYLLRLLAPHARLYTEMITARALLHGDAERLLRFEAIEHPVALQLGGADPSELATAARLGAAAGYDEINLNVGCPSDRVQAGCFGAALMLERARVAECVRAMRAAVDVPVTVKTRLGVDEHDSYEFARDFVAEVAAAGCTTFIVHARKAWLKGLSPKQNREIPPLDYGRVHRLKREFPELRIVINGGLVTLEDSIAQLDACRRRHDRPRGVPGLVAARSTRCAAHGRRCPRPSKRCSVLSSAMLRARSSAALRCAR